MAGFMFYMHDGPTTFRFELSGSLAGDEVNKLDQAWKTASSTFDGKVLAVDVTFLSSVDQKGRDLLLRWWRVGARLIANSAASQALVESITGDQYLSPGSTVGPTFDPRFTAGSLRAVFVAAVVALSLLFPVTASATSLPFHGGGMLRQEIYQNVTP